MPEDFHRTTDLRLGTLPSGGPVKTTVHTYAGEAGPTLYVQAAQHGREINGTETLRRFHHRLESVATELTGTIVAVPVANPITFDRVSYTAPNSLDSVNGNMNRVWPGDATGTLHQRMAAELWEYVKTADAVVDLHTGSPDMLPHVVYTADDSPSKELAAAFGTDLLLGERANEAATDSWHRRNFDGKLRVAATQAGIPAITPELGYNRQILEAVVELAVDGLTDLCRHLGMLPGDVQRRDQQMGRNHLGQVNASESGLFRPEPTLDVGDRVTDGQTLGALFGPMSYERRQIVTANRDGLLYALRREATVTPGDSLASIAVLESS